MKMTTILGCGILFAFGWYGWLIPTAWHADDASVFSEAHKSASHLGAIILAIIPPGIGYTIFAINKLAK